MTKRGDRRLGASLDSELTDLEARFVEEYLVDMNATQAYIRAGGCDTSGVVACKLLQKPHVVQALAAMREQRRRDAEFRADDLAEALIAKILLNPDDYMNPDGSLKHIPSLSIHVQRALNVEMEADSEGNVRLKKVKPHDPYKAAELLGKLRGWFSEKQVLEHQFADMSDEQLRDRIKRLTGVAPE